MKQTDLGQAPEALAMVGTIAVGARAGTSPTAREVREEVRPQACAIGWTAITVMTNFTSSPGLTAQQQIVYQVWAPQLDRQAVSTTF